jgi:hypothetical protein
LELVCWSNVGGTLGGEVKGVGSCELGACCRAAAGSASVELGGAGRGRGDTWDAEASSGSVARPADDADNKDRQGRTRQGSAFLLGIELLAMKEYGCHRVWRLDGVCRAAIWDAAGLCSRARGRAAEAILLPVPNVVFDGWRPRASEAGGKGESRQPDSRGL